MHWNFLYMSYQAEIKMLRQTNATNYFLSLHFNDQTACFTARKFNLNFYEAGCSDAVNDDVKLKWSSNGIPNLRYRIEDD